MGHLLLDGVFDEEKYERGVIKLLRAPAEEDQLEVSHLTRIHKRHHHKKKMQIMLKTMFKGS